LVTTVSVTPAFASDVSAETPDFPGTKYGETSSSLEAGRPMIRSSRGHSISFGRARPSPFAGSSLTSATGAHSKSIVPPRNAAVNGDSSIAFEIELCLRPPRDGVVRARHLRGHPFGPQPIRHPMRRRALPIALEIARHLAHHRSDGQRVEIDEQRILAGPEIRIADVATADDRRAVVGGERLVVHPAVEPREIGDEPQQAPAADDERIEKAGSRDWGGHRARGARRPFRWCCCRRAGAARERRVRPPDATPGTAAFRSGRLRQM
jgi:hypothetical protein